MSQKKRLTRNFAKDRETLKTLNWKQKIRFCFDYYKGYCFILFVCLLISFYIGDMVYQSHQIIDLQGFFINDEHNLFPAKTLIKDFSNYIELPAGHRIAFEDSLFVDLDSSSEYTAASQGKVVAYIAAKELDFVVAPKELAEFYCQSFSLYDLEELIPEDLKTELLDHLYYAKDGTGITKACALDLSDSRFMRGSEAESPCYLLVLSYTQRMDAMISFLRYAYEV